MEDEQARERIPETIMRIAFGGHLDELSVDQFKRVVLAEDASLGHSPNVGGAERPAVKAIAARDHRDARNPLNVHGPLSYG